MASNLFRAGVTYDVVTPESAADGDVSESGWQADMEPCTFREAYDTLRKYGPFAHVQDNGTHLSAYDCGESVDYRTGETTSYCVHVYASPRNLTRLKAAFDARMAKDVARRTTYRAHNVGMWDTVYTYTVHVDRTAAHERQNKGDNSIRLVISTE